MKLKIIFSALICSILISHLPLLSQNIGINSDGSAPDASAMLDIKSTNKGILIPRINITNLNDISPITGGSIESLLVYNTNTTTGKGYYYWNGSIWVNLSKDDKAWGIAGNTETTPSSSAIGSSVNNNFIGTTDNKDFVFATNNLERLRIKSNGSIGIGTNNPDQPLTVAYDTEWNIVSRSKNTTATNRNHLLFQRANGSSAVSAGFTLGGLSMGGYDGTNYSYGWNGGAEITALASENWTAANRGTNLIFSVSKNGSTSPTEIMRISANGNVGIGEANPSEKLHINGSTRISSLAGVGNRIVYSDVNGKLINNTATIKTDVIFIRGTGYNNMSNRIVKIGNITVVNGSGRGLTLTIIKKSDHSIISSTNYDTYGNTTDADNLATQLNNIDKDQIGILTSYDAWEQSVTTNLKTAFLRLGLIKAYNTGTGARRPYAAIFEASSSTTVASDHVVEIEYSTDANQPFAEIRGWLIEGGFSASGSLPSALTTPLGVNSVNVIESGNVGIKIKTSDTYALAVNGYVIATDYYYLSDRNLKRNIITINSPLKKLMALRGVNFEWKNKEFKDLSLDNKVHYGFIAQEVEKIAPELIEKTNFNDSLKSVNYVGIVPILVEAVKEQQHIIEKQNDKIEQQNKDIEELRKIVMDLKSKID